MTFLLSPGYYYWKEENNYACLVVVLLAGTVTVNAATGGLVGDYFSNLLGGDDAIAVISWGDDSECRIEINIEESSSTQTRYLRMIS